MTPSVTRRRGQAGMISLDVMLSVLVLLAVTSVGVAIMGVLPDVQRAQQLGLQTATLSTALHNYVGQNFSAIQKGPATTAMVPFDALVGGGFLPPSFPASDPWNDPYILQYAVTGATAVGYGVGMAAAPPVGKGILAWAANVANGHAANGDIADIVGRNAALGRAGGWDGSVAALAAAPPPSGTVAMVGFVGSGALIADYLYRDPVPGHPEAQQMNTGIDMQGNDIANGGNVLVDNLTYTGTLGR